MILLIHAQITAARVAENPGQPECDVHFALEKFRPILEKLGAVKNVENPETDVDAIHAECAARDEACVFLSFSLPNRTPLNLTCPTLPVFAWEFDTIPDEAWDNDARHDWRHCLGRAGWAIVHSAFAAEAVRAAMGSDFPVLPLPAPVWDDVDKLRIAFPRAALPGKIALPPERILFDTRTTDLSAYAPNRSTEALPVSGENTLLPKTVAPDIEGILYTTILSPYDSRKNWVDMLFAFCWAFGDTPDATLIMELTDRDNSMALESFKKCLYQLTPFKCRVVAVQGPLDNDNRTRLMQSTAYFLNASHAEGQCLPLMEFLSFGVPAVAPRHTALVDYIDDGVAFVAGSSAQPTCWPDDDGRQAYRAKCYRIDCESLANALAESYRVARTDPERYAAMSRTAHERLGQYCSRAVVEGKLRNFLSIDRRMLGKAAHT